MCTPRDDRSNARSTHADSSILLRGHSQPSVGESYNGSVESTTPSKESLTLEWQTHARYAKSLKPDATGYHPEKISALASWSIHQTSGWTRPSQSPLAPDHDIWSPPAVPSPTKAAWNPPAAVSVCVFQPLSWETTSGIHQQRHDFTSRPRTKFRTLLGREFSPTYSSHA